MRKFATKQCFLFGELGAFFGIIGDLFGVLGVLVGVLGVLFGVIGISLVYFITKNVQLCVYSL